MKSVIAAFAVFLAWSGLALAAPADDIADALNQALSKPITVDTVASDFARLTRFVRHDANNMVLFTDGGSTDGYVRHAQAHFDISQAPRAAGSNDPLFTIALELVEQPDFTFEAFAAALERRLGTPATSSTQPGAVFRRWILKNPTGRSLTIAQAQGSDNGDFVTVVQIMQSR
jgi:hypothetical protein